MAKKRPPPGLCVHCLRQFEKLTWDHVLPEAWYPETTPENLAKWKIPCCLHCNGLHSKNEGDLLIRLGLCIDRENPRGAGIAEKALRALDPASAKNHRDATARAAKRAQILRQSFDGPEIPRQSLYPGFDVDPVGTEAMAVTVSAKGLRLFVEKLARGITYLEDHKFIAPPYVIEHHVVTEANALPFRECLARWGKVHECGPGIRVVRAVVPEDRVSAVFEIEIWGRFKAYASVVEEE